MNHIVDVVIAVHDLSRPVERAVGSVLDGTTAAVRVTVVAHGISANDVSQRLARHTSENLRVISLDDGIRSPAGPFNAGLAELDAPWFSVMGSDDTLEPGAIDSWLAITRRDDSTAVIARQKRANGTAIPTPPVRMWRTRRLEGARDRLSYRSAPLGLFSRAEFGGLRFTEGVAVGEDLAYVTAIWFSTAELSYDRHGPAYLVHDDARERTSSAPRSLDDEFAWWRELSTSALWKALNTDEKQAAITKFLRIHLFGAVWNRSDPHWWSPLERTSLATITRQMAAEAGDIDSVLSRREHALLGLACDPAAPIESLLAAAHARRAFSHPGALLPRRLRHTFHPQGALAVAFHSWLQTRR